MKILTVYAHPDPKSFCHAVLEQFMKGLKDAGHTNEVIDLYSIGFDPVLKTRDFPNWLPDENGCGRKGVEGTSVCRQCSAPAANCRVEHVSQEESLGGRYSAEETRTERCAGAAGEGGKSTSSGVHIPRLVRRVSSHSKGLGRACIYSWVCVLIDVSRLARWIS